MPRPDPSLPWVFSHAVARRSGYSESQVRTRVSRGDWRVLRRGVYCLAASWDGADRRAQARIEGRAALARLGTGYWLSHESAAAEHDLPLPVTTRGSWLTRQPPAGTKYLDRLVVEAATLPDGDQWVNEGAPVTSLRRTVADCLRHCDPPDGLAIADAASRRFPYLLDSVVRVLDDCEEWPYLRRAFDLLPLVDGRRESPLESRSAWLMHLYEVPDPEPQVDLYSANGTFLGRVDFWWDDVGLVGEADGLTKYDVGADGDPQTVVQRLVAEKRREDALREAGVRVVRWGFRDLADPKGWARDLHRRIDDGRPSQFTGEARSTKLPAWGAA